MAGDSNRAEDPWEPPPTDWPVLAAGTTTHEADPRSVTETITLLVTIPAAATHVAAAGGSAPVLVCMLPLDRLVAFCSQPIFYARNKLLSPVVTGLMEVGPVGQGWFSMRRPASAHRAALRIPNGTLLALCQLVEESSSHPQLQLARDEQILEVRNKKGYEEIFWFGYRYGYPGNERV